MTAADPTRSLSIDSFAPGGYDGPPLPDPLPAAHGEPVLDPITREREPVVYVLDAYGRSVPMLKSQVPVPAPHTPRDLTPEPLIDRTAQRLVAGGACAVGAGYGASLAFNAAAGLGTGLFAIAAAVVAFKLPAMGKKITNNVTNHTTINATNSSKWFGKSTTSTTTNTHK